MTTGGPETGVLPGRPVRAILKLTYRCTNRCRFCRVDDSRGTVRDMPLDAAAARLVEAKSLGVQMVLFSGGEPTLRDDLPRIVRAATSLGLSWGLITNGRRLAYPEYRRALLDLGLAYVHTSLHGATAATHDAIVQCAGHRDVLRAIEGLRGAGVELHVNTVITRSNLAELGAISDLLAGLGPLTHKLCLMEPRGLFHRYEQDLLVRPEQAARAATAVAREMRKRFPGTGFRCEIEGFPHCQVPPDLAAGLHTHGIRYLCEGFEDRFYPADHGERAFLAPCEACAAREDCPGVYRGYAQRFGASGLRPITASRPRRSPARRPPRAD